MAETSFISFPSGRPRKRPKIERDSDDTILPDLPLLEIDRPLWLADGNVVIIAQSQTAFRVHKSVLLRHSDAFKTLLAVAEPTFGETSKVEGCPVVHTEDTAHDFKHLLHALYDGLE
ncbi:hypothetical protein TRAPUB_9048 [Trametes pubescens]|uniref:BTB domain-containing protein n=1 Tax=Trametes pubescens TaxID=154538 RepID=A0A1M2W3G6_TRAPU|nr:hypothetical protein TRAPUB_9048 [Trametes pubescens]